MNDELINRTILANYANVSDTNMCTTIENEYGIKISTIEHLMAALSGSGVDNVDIEIDGSEVPIMDGSSGQFIDLIENSGLEKLSEKRKFLKIKEHIEIIDGDKRILIVNGKPVPYGLSRIPAKGETRGNLAAGGRGEGRELTEREERIRLSEKFKFTIPTILK